MVSNKNMFLCLMFFAVSCAYAMDKYPLLQQSFKTLPEAQRWEYRRQLEEWRASPEHAQESMVDQVQLYKAAAANIEKKEKQNNGEDKKDS